ncbi:hypothetical protein ACWD00_30405, partial [Streptomyces viridiviolaceus]
TSGTPMPTGAAEPARTTQRHRPQTHPFRGPETSGTPMPTGAAEPARTTQRHRPQTRPFGGRRRPAPRGRRAPLHPPVPPWWHDCPQAGRDVTPPATAAPASR